MNMPDDLRLSKNVKRHVTGKNSPHSRWRSCVHLWNVVIIAFACLLTTSTASSLHTSKSVINNDDVPTVHTHSRGLSIFGVDDTKPVSDASLFPYSSVGLLQWNSDHICTATLIGSRFAVTAAECVLSPDGKELVSTKPQFRVGLGASAMNAKINKIHRQSDFWKKWTEDTYVILELDSALGDTLGKVLLPVLEDLDQSVGKTFVQMVGFDEDAAKATAASPPILKFSKCTCYFPASFNGPQYLIHHDCDTSVKGSPGSPLFVRYTSMDTYIIGIHTNVIDGAKVPETSATFPTFTDANANRGVLGPFIQKHLVALESGNNSTIAKDEPGSTNTSTPRTTSDKQGQDGSDKEIKSKSDGSISNENQNSKKTLSPSVAYVAIGLVGGAWVCILFIVLRHIRRGKPQQ